MPSMHRLACFRDDLIFFVYLYQRWVYPTDFSRVNEFGQGGESNGEGEGDGEGERGAGVGVGVGAAGASRERERAEIQEG